MACKKNIEHKRLVTSKVEASLYLNRFDLDYDPCFLGRYNNIYGQPRKVLEAIPEVKLVEMLLTEFGILWLTP